MNSTSENCKSFETIKSFDNAASADSGNAAGQAENSDANGQAENTSAAGQTENSSASGQAENGNSAQNTASASAESGSSSGKSIPASFSRVLTLEFWENVLRAIMEDGPDARLDNPALEFTGKAKAGEYDSLSDEEYEALLKECETLAAFWHEYPSRSAADVLADALASLSANAVTLRRLARVLARCGMTVPQKAAAAVSAGDVVAPAALSPRSIYRCLDKRIHGQDKAKKAASMAVYNHLEGRRSNSLFCGPTGSGKTEIWRQLALEYPKLIRVVDASRLAADGWKGSVHLRDIFDGIPESRLKNDGLIVVLDEADKMICEPQIGSSGTDYSAIIQNSLLKMLDGDVLEFGYEDSRRPAFRVDCSRVSVVLLGAFEKLLGLKSRSSGGLGFAAPPRTEYSYSNTAITADDLIRAGMRREIAGRINRITALSPLTVDEFEFILTGLVLHDLEQSNKCTITIDENSARSLAEEAKASGLGVRYMRSRVMSALDDLVFDNPGADRYRIRL